MLIGFSRDKVLGSWVENEEPVEEAKGSTSTKRLRWVIPLQVMISTALLPREADLRHMQEVWGLSKRALHTIRSPAQAGTMFPGRSDSTSAYTARFSLPAIVLASTPLARIPAFVHDTSGSTQGAR